ncbi:MAG: SO_0444 family Cu/Zn efflux transporter [Candidatus Omnitrophota bacterium]
MNIIIGILRESYFLFNKMSPYLVFGFLFAGVLHVFIDTSTVSRHLGKSSLFSVIKAALFGIPLPLCSCSVIPAAMALRKEGASKGSVLSFLISTPTTGVDSIFATYSLLGGLFTVYRVIASFVTGVLSGIIANIFLKEDNHGIREEPVKCKLCNEHGVCEHGLYHKIGCVFTYAFGDLLKDSGGALLIGIFIGGVITYFLPGGFIERYLGAGINAMVIMLLVGIPMYVCATASIPIAAALMLKGMNPGAAFVFLVAGPATNIVTMIVVAKNIGKNALVIYLGSIALSSLVLGFLLDKVYLYFGQIDSLRFIIHRKAILPEWLGISTSVVLFILIVYNFVKRD